MEILKRHKKAIDIIKPFIDLGNFYLAGGTAVYYYLRHRESKDLGFFTEKLFDFQKCDNIFHGQGVYFRSRDTVHTRIQNVKVSFLYYPHKLLNPPERLDNINVASLEDILCMKVNAIIGRGSRKDFADLYFIVKELSINANRVIELYKRKFGNCNSFIVRKALVYFRDADNEPQLKMLKPVKWREIKRFFIQTLTKLG